MKIVASRYQRRRATDADPLHLKIRVRILRPMTQTQAESLLARAVASGVVPSGIEIRWLDWEKGTGGTARSGTITGPVFHQLRTWYGAMTKGTVRMAKVRREGER